MDTLAEVNQPQIVLSLTKDGQVTMRFNGMWPPATLFAAAGMLARVANRVIDATEDSQAQMMNQLQASNMGKPRGS